ncbi:MAG: ribonuclease PH [Planctomycetes bacterium]|nr:ribonuclease PH [Planctomycetota bacterium]
MSSKRRPDQPRPTRIEPFPTASPGSVVITQGKTRVLCTANVDADLPGWLRPRPGEPPKSGWVTAEYSMLPGSTPQRKKRGPDGRATEIQRLIGRVLRASVDMDKMPGVSITVDCDVLHADGGTRTASITGGFVALARCIRHARGKGLIKGDPVIGPVAAISVGVVDGVSCVDLDYDLDSRADVDMNVAIDHRGRFIEVQGTGERTTFTRPQLDRLLDLALSASKKLIAVQRRAVR